MVDAYEAHAPTEFPSPQEQSAPPPEPVLEEVQIPDLRNTLDRWRRELLDRIQFLKENLEQANQEKTALTQELDSLKAELAASRQQVQELQNDLSATLGAFNNMLKEVSAALQS